ncbi:hypothetical protein M405DRAFT_867360 [Rhizopogon salebrosus TDB-379]|nr:hypothetical protein M405DRAFT_867360 [Rhizopogon salebrosus TDB-379]
MLSVASAEPHPDLQGALKKIKKGGKKAAAWLKDKIEGTKFALPALYQPNSLIPLEIWRASPSTTNGNEQAHRNINRDGVSLTLLGGSCEDFTNENLTASLDIFDAFGINSSDRLSTHAHRAKRALSRRLRYSARFSHDTIVNADAAVTGATITSATQAAHIRLKRIPPLCLSSRNTIRKPSHHQRSLL